MSLASQKNRVMKTANKQKNNPYRHRLLRCRTPGSRQDLGKLPCRNPLTNEFITNTFYLTLKFPGTRSAITSFRDMALSHQQILKRRFYENAIDVPGSSCCGYRLYKFCKSSRS